MSLIQKWRGLPRLAYVFGVANFVIAAGAFIMPFLTLVLSNKLGMSTMQTAFFVNVVFFAYVPATFLGGWLTDRFGRKPIYILAISLEIVMTSIAGFFAEQFELLYFLFAIAFLNGMVTPVVQAWQADYSTPENRQMVYATSYFGWNLGFAIGPAIAGLLFNAHFQLMFWGDAISTFIGMSVVLLFLPTKKPSAEETSSVPEQEEHFEGNMFRLLVSRPRLLLFAVVGYFMNLIYGQMAFTVPLHLNDVFGEDGPAMFGQIWAVNAFFVVVFTPIIGSYFGRFSSYTNIAIMGVCYAVGFGFFGSSTYFLLLLSFIAVFTFGEVLGATSFPTHIANESPKNFRGRLSGILTMMIGAGYGMSPLLSGIFIETWGIDALWPTAFAIGLISAVAMLLLKPRGERTA